MPKLPTLYRFERTTCARCKRDSPYCAPCRVAGDRDRSFRPMCATCRLALQALVIKIPVNWNDGFQDDKNEQMHEDDWNRWREANPPLEIEEE